MRRLTMLIMAAVAVLFATAAVHDINEANRVGSHRDRCIAAGGEPIRSQFLGNVCAKLIVLDVK